jgi:nitroimidazol reductase NimA-like FMN-containing flavoprotein (pyridoxamine 5'-phosphate oxidase superfamily)
MRITEISSDECKLLLSRVFVGRLACALEDQPYVVPVCFSYEADHLYVFSTTGQKIKWMRKNPKVCLQADETRDRSDWTSVVVNGTYVELREPQYTDEKQQARKRLAKVSDWWQTPLVGRRERTSDLAIEPVFFRIDIASMSGLRGVPDAE